LTASALLAFNVNQIWFSRFPTPEAAAQFFILAGLVCLLDTLERPRTATAFLGALSFEAAALAKVDVLPLVYILIGVAALRIWTAREAPEAPFGLFLLLFHGLFEPYRLASAGTYTGRILGDFGANAGTGAFAFFGLALLLLSGMILRSRLSRPPLPVGTRKFGGLRLALAVALPLAGVLAYLLWPRLSSDPDARNLISLGWLLTPPGLLAALSGASLALVRLAGDRVLYLFSVILPMSVLSIASWKLTPIHFWATKRYQVVTLAACILFAVLLYDLLLKKHRLGQAAFLALVLAMILLPARKALPWVTRPDYREYPAFTTRLAARFEPGDVVLCRSERPAAPLHFLHGVQTLVFRPRSEEHWARAKRWAGRWESEGRRVFLLGESRNKIPPPAGWRLVDRDRLETSRMERKKGGLPSRRLDASLDVPLYLHGVEEGGSG
jgi:hypothetical protein